MDDLPEGTDRSSSSRASNVTEIKVNANGLGVWVCAICCAAMLGMSSAGIAILMIQDRKISELQAYLSAIYMQAPHLRPDESEDH